MRTLRLLLACQCLLGVAQRVCGGDETDTTKMRVAVLSLSKGGLVSMNVDGSDPVLVAKGDIAAAKWSPDGKQIVYFSHKPRLQLWIMNADGTGAKRLLTDFKHPQHGPNWSPDGKRIVFVAQLGPEYSDREILVVDADGQNILNLSKHPEVDDHPAWSPDGKTISFRSYRKRPPRLFFMNIDGSIECDRFLRANTTAWSPGGQLIAFSEDKVPGGGGGHLFVASPDGRSTKQLSSEGENNSLPAWSPDGRYIAYVRYWEWSKDLSIRGDLVIFNVVRETHTTILKDDVPKLIGGRPAWVPFVKGTPKQGE